MPKTSDYDKTHLRNLALIATRIDRIFKTATEEAAKIGATITTPLREDKIFNFNDYPRTHQHIERLLSKLQESVETIIVNGVRSAWTLSNNKNNALSARVFGKQLSKLTEEQQRRYFSTNAQALESFLQRKAQGLNLSDRVWKYTDAFKHEIELALDLGIRSGESAAQMTRSLRQYLQHPEQLFRRVRDRHGLLQLSRAAQEFHPGTGVYRSSYKNARRLAATETNIAYRTSDHLRWQQMDFVVGIEIQLSNNHTVLLQPGERTSDPSQQRRDGSPKANAVRPLTDICDTLAGRYPKDFKFTGWHPHCRCRAISILKTDEELAADTERLLRGQEPTTASVNTVRDVPAAFRQWLTDNADRISRAQQRATLPLFLKDNQPLIKRLLSNGSKASTLERAAERHAKRTSEDIERIQKSWNERRLRHAMDGIVELDIYKSPTLHDFVRLLEDDIALGEYKFFEKDFADFTRMIKAARDVEYMNTERLMNTPLFKANNDDVEKIFGARGMAMPFKPANELRGNPHYYASEAYRVNCQTCVVAHELRRRGFNLEALANTKGSALERLSYHTESAWIDANGNIPHSTVIGLRKIKRRRWDGREYEAWEKTAKNRKQLVAALESELVDDGRYHIKWNWANEKSGHIITVERVNGKFRYYDPQTGRVIDDFVKYIDGIKLKDGLRCLRVDNLRVNPGIAGKVLTKPTAAKSGAAATGGTARLPQQRITEIRRNAEQWCNENLPRIALSDGNTAKRAIVRHSSGKDIVVNSDTFGEIWHKNKNRNNLDEILNIAKDFTSWLPDAQWIRKESGIHHAFQFNVYETTINGQRIEIKTKLTDAEYLYNIRFI